jgi:hypothetical protein
MNSDVEEHSCEVLYGYVLEFVWGGTEWSQGNLNTLDFFIFSNVPFSHANKCSGYVVLVLYEWVSKEH